jgi:hypothetical protein
VFRKNGELECEWGREAKLKDTYKHHSEINTLLSLKRVTHITKAVSTKAPYIWKLYCDKYSRNPR